MVPVIKEKLLRLMETKDISDISIKVGKNGKTFSTHKFLLSIYSKVFQSMLHGPLREKNSEITLPDDEPMAFEIFLKYIYTDQIELKSVEEAIFSLYFADKYFVQGMKDKCVIYLIDNLNSENVLQIHDAASVLHESKLEFKCMEFIIEFFDEIIKNDFIKNASFQTMLQIVSEESIKLNSEVDMYNAVVKWGKETNRDHTPDSLRENLKPLLRHVRFLSMSHSEFVEGPCQDEILTKSEQLEILKEMSSSKEYKSNIIETRWRRPRKLLNKQSLFVCYPKEFVNSEFPVALEFKCEQLMFINGIFICIKFNSATFFDSEIKYKSLLKITNLSSKISEKCEEYVIIGSSFKDNFIRIPNAILVKENEIVRLEFKLVELKSLENPNLCNDISLDFRSLILAFKEEKFNLPMLNLSMMEHLDIKVLGN